MPSTNTISKPINELEKMLDTNKDSTGKVPATFTDNLSPILVTDHLLLISFWKTNFGLINFKLLIGRY